MEFIVDEKKCTHCGLCVPICSPRVLEMGEHGIPRVREGKGDNCMQCQHCLMVCPTGAVSVNGKSPEDSVPCCDLPNADAVDRLIRCRRSHRIYKQKNVSPAVVSRLMDAMAYAPTGVNVQKLHFAVIDDIAVMEIFRRRMYDRLREARDAGKIDEAFERFASMVETYDKHGYDTMFRGAPHIVVVTCPPDIPCPIADPFIALSYFELLAQSMGIGTTWCGLAYWGLTIFAPDLVAELKLPEGHEVKYCMLFGESETTFVRGAQRGPVSRSKVTLQ